MLELLIAPNQKKMRYLPVGRCIYCGSEKFDPADPSHPLSLEHIIPEGIGGTYLLPEASCKRCAGITSSFERGVLRRTLGPLRIHFKLPSKRSSKKRPVTLPIWLKGDDGEIEEVAISIDEHPLLCIVPHLDPPLILDKPNGGDRKAIVIFPKGKDYTDRLMQNIYDKYGRAVHTQAAMSGDSLVLLLAKIAHSMTCAAAGYGNFQPFLVESILRKDNEALKLFVGASTEDIARPGYVHNLKPHYIYRGRQKLISWRISLFSPFGFPTYEVVAGRRFENVTERGRVGGQFMREEIAIEAPGST